MPALLKGMFLPSHKPCLSEPYVLTPKSAGLKPASPLKLVSRNLGEATAPRLSLAPQQKASFRVLWADPPWLLKDTGYFLGCGYWTHSNAEICPLATRGRPKRVGTGIPGLIVSPRREHSQKPDEARGRIVRLCGDVPRAELFARQKTAGWSAWGNEVDCDFSFPQR